MIKHTSPFSFALDVLSHNSRCKNHMKTFRYNESGDFYCQDTVNWMVALCTVLSAHGIVCYGYSAATDLDLSDLINVSGLNASNDEGDWRGKGANRFKTVLDYSGTADFHCGGDCSKCSACYQSDGILIETIKR